MSTKGRGDVTPHIGARRYDFPLLIFLPFHIPPEDLPHLPPPTSPSSSARGSPVAIVPGASPLHPWSLWPRGPRGLRLQPLPLCSNHSVREMRWVYRVRVDLPTPLPLPARLIIVVSGSEEVLLLSV